MKKQWITTVLAIAIAMVVGMFAGVANAADLTWTGTGVDDGTWIHGGAGKFGGPTWNNATPDSATFAGTAETVTLGGDISVSNLTINMNYDIVQGASQSYVLSFAAGGGITAIITGNGTSITAGITNSPTFYLDPSNHNQIFEFAPVGASVTLGNITVQSHGPQVDLGGSTTGNSITNVTNAKIRCNGTGASEWTVTGLASAYEHFIASGKLIMGPAGTLKSNSRAVKVDGGILYYNNPGAVFNDASGNSGINDGDNIWMSGGDLDNSSGSPITTSTYNPRMSWGDDWTFIGSLGANSDLNYGTGAVGLFYGDRQVTIADAATTLTLGGVVHGSYGLTKAGPGTLKLTGVNTYSGNTIVNAGTLSLGDGTANSSLADDKDLRIAAAAGAKVELDFVGTDTVFAVLFDGVAGAAGTWGPDLSGADHETNALTGTGMLYSDGGVLTDAYLWDGPTTGGDGDGASDGGSGTWSTSVTNWDHGYVAREVWDNGADDNAVFGGSGGTVTLGESINVSNLTFDAPTAHYTLQGSNMNFAAGGSIEYVKSAANRNLTISSAISGSPDLTLASTHNHRMYLLPTSGSVKLGTVTSGMYLYLGGTTDGNELSDMAQLAQSSYVYKQDTSTWTVSGDMYYGILYLNGGTLICNGTLINNYQGIKDVQSGARLAGDCTVGSGDPGQPYSFSILNGGILSPGTDGTGKMTFDWGNSNADRTMTLADGSIYEWDVSATTNDTIHLDGHSGANIEKLDMNSFELKIQDATGGAYVDAGQQFPVFTYTDMTIDTNGFPNAPGNFNTSALGPEWDIGTLKLTDNGSGTIYLTGLSKPPPAGTMILLR